MFIGSNTPIKPAVPIVQAPPPSSAEDRNASEKPKAEQNTAAPGSNAGNNQPTETRKAASAPPPAPAPAPAESARPSESASRGAEARVVGNAIPQESDDTAIRATAAPAESDRLKDMRAALAVVTELAENPVSDRMAQLFSAAEANEAAESDGAGMSADDQQSSIRSEQAREGYATTRSLSEDKQAA